MTCYNCPQVKTCPIYITLEAAQDIQRTCDYIKYEIKEPVIADRYRQGIDNTIAGLFRYGPSLAISPYESVQKHYGPDARTITYKRVTIIYNVIGDKVYIRRVIAAELIK
jgi:hypothetical protein